MRAFNLTVAKLKPKGTRIWSFVVGPVGAAVASAWRLGWRTPTAGVMVTDQGVSINLATTPAAQLRWEVRRAVRRWRLGRITAAHPDLVPAAFDHAGVTPGVRLYEATVDFAGAVGRVLRRGPSPKL